MQLHVPDSHQIHISKSGGICNAKRFFFLFCNNIKELSFTKSLGNSKEQQDFPSFRMSLKQKQPRPLE